LTWRGKLQAVDRAYTTKVQYPGWAELLHAYRMGYQAQEKLCPNLGPSKPWLGIVEMKKRPMERAETASLEMSRLGGNLTFGTRIPTSNLPRNKPNHP